MILPCDARNVLARLELVSHGATLTYNTSGGGRSAERTLKPPGDEHPPHLYWLRRMLSQPGNVAQLTRDAEKEWRQLTGITATPKPKTPVKVEPPHLRREEIIARGAGWDASDVAKAYKTTVRAVINIRVAAGRDPSTGRVPPGEEDAMVQARRLKGQGLTVRQIGAYQGVPKSTVQRRLQAAA